MKRFFPKNLCEFRNCFIACYIVAIGMVGYYAYKSCQVFFDEKRSVMEVVAYKIASDLINILDHSESSLNIINTKIIASDKSKESVANILLEAGKSYNQTLLKYELSTGKFYWIDNTNYLSANSDVGLVANPIDLSNRDYLQNTRIDSRKIYVGAPIIGASSGQYVIPMGVGAEDSVGNYVGTMVVSFKLSDLADRYRKIADEFKINFALLNSDNSIIVESVYGIYADDKKLFADLSMQKINVAEEFIAPFSLTKRDNSYVVLRASDKYQYKILAGYQNKYLLQELGVKIACCLLQFLIVTLFFVLAMFYLRKDCSV